MKEKKTTATFVLADDTKLMLKKLGKIQCRSQAGVITYLIKKEAKEHGLIESMNL